MATGKLKRNRVWGRVGAGRGKKEVEMPGHFPSEKQGGVGMVCLLESCLGVWAAIMSYKTPDTASLCAVYSMQRAFPTHQAPGLDFTGLPRGRKRALHCMVRYLSSEEST